MGKFIKAATDSGNLDIKIREIDSEFSPEEVETITDEIAQYIFDNTTDTEIDALKLEMEITFYRNSINVWVREKAIGKREYFGQGASNSLPRYATSRNSDVYLDEGYLNNFGAKVKKYVKDRIRDSKKVAAFEEQWGELPEDVLLAADRVSSPFIAKKLGGATDLDDGREFALNATVYNNYSDWSRPEFSGMANRYINAIFDFAEENGMSCKELIDFVKKAKHYCNSTGHKN